MRIKVTKERAVKSTVDRWPAHEGEVIYRADPVDLTGMPSNGLGRTQDGAIGNLVRAVVAEKPDTSWARVVIEYCEEPEAAGMDIICPACRNRGPWERNDTGGWRCTACRSHVTDKIAERLLELEFDQGTITAKERKAAIYAAHSLDDFANQRPRVTIGCEQEYSEILMAMVNRKPAVAIPESVVVNDSVYRMTVKAEEEPRRHLMPHEVDFLDSLGRSSPHSPAEQPEPVAVEDITPGWYWTCVKGYETSHTQIASASDVDTFGPLCKWYHAPSPEELMAMCGEKTTRQFTGDETCGECYRGPFDKGLCEQGRENVRDVHQRSIACVKFQLKLPTEQAQ